MHRGVLKKTDGLFTVRPNTNFIKINPRTKTNNKIAVPLTHIPTSLAVKLNTIPTANFHATFFFQKKEKKKMPLYLPFLSFSYRIHAPLSPHSFPQFSLTVYPPYSQLRFQTLQSIFILITYKLRNCYAENNNII